MTHEKENDLKDILSAEQCGDLTLLVASTIQAMRHSLWKGFHPSTSEIESASRGDLMESVSSTSQGGKLKRKVHPLVLLEQEALKNFDEWADRVLGRIGEVVNSSREASRPGDTTEQHSPSTPQNRRPGVYAYRSVETDLVKTLPSTHFPLLLNSLLLLVLSLERYDARSRTLLHMISASLHMDPHSLTEHEIQVANVLTTACAQLTASEEASKRARDSRISRRWKVGLASVAGAVVIGITGGLAAPLVAAGIGSILGGIGLGGTVCAAYLGVVASNGAILGSLFGVYGGVKAANEMEKYAAEVSDFHFLPVRPLKNRLRVTLGITGWLSNINEIVDPWKVLNADGEQYALRWEVDALLDLGVAIETMIRSYAWKYLKMEIMRRTVLAPLLVALWPIGLLRFAQVVDNPWKIASERALKAGKVLADALINRTQGERPVTLIGFSLGARVIYSCLLSLASRNAFGIIENAYLLGAPIPTDTAEWVSMRAVVASRLVNVYSTNDLVLAFTYRTASVQIGVAGLKEIQGVPGVENVDVSDVVAGHSRWRGVVGQILGRGEYVGAEDIDLLEVSVKLEEEEREDMKIEERRESGDDDIEQVMAKAAVELYNRRKARNWPPDIND